MKLSLILSLSLLLLLLSPLAFAFVAPSATRTFYSQARGSLLARSAWHTNDQHEFAGVRKQWVTTPLHPRDVPNAAKSQDEQQRTMSMDYTNDSYRRRRNGNYQGRMLPPARGGSYYNDNDAVVEENGMDVNIIGYDVRDGQRRRGDYDDDDYRRYEEERFVDYPEEKNVVVGVVENGRVKAKVATK